MRSCNASAAWADDAMVRCRFEEEQPAVIPPGVLRVAQRSGPTLRGPPCFTPCKNGTPHLRLHPFGLIPTYEEGELVLFETDAIVFHIAEHHAGLLPDGADARARAITWMFAALNTVEPPILELVVAKFAEGDKPWDEERLPLVKDRIRAAYVARGEARPA